MSKKFEVESFKRDFYKQKELLKPYLKKSSPLYISSPYIDKYNWDKILSVRSPTKSPDKKEFRLYNKKKESRREFIITTPKKDQELRLNVKDKWITKKGFDVIKKVNLLVEKD